MQFNSTKFFSSILILILLAVTSNLFGYYFLRQPNDHILKTVKFLLLVFFVCSFFSLLKINFLNTIKPVGFFSEPSHFAITISPILLFYSLSKSKGYMYILIYYLIWSLLVQNATLLIITAICFLFVFSNKKKMLLLIIPVLLLLKPLLNNKYFSDRLDINSNSENISVLIFLNGWEKAQELLSVTSGLGIGFQQLGYYKLMQKTPVGEQLSYFGLEQLNKYDAGSIAPKIISEFGFAGIVCLIVFLFFYGHFFIMIIKQKQNNSLSELFLIACFLSFTIELFIRGIGYFSVGTFLFVASISNLPFKKLLIKNKK